ncbi:asparaginase [Corynebacterium marquesiae]|uniref:asparaginase n=1 Tax=Corynebacterium marquesiae TaxID=2913503 RepID=A0ABU8P5M4_9CORY|nr:asparaginase [Corynebacterium marquesiae]MCZ9300993.1 asparaginase [Corynebacterium marquesiae]MDK8495303.1 asparaginase [Corynebacterium marquesiae]
MHTSTMRRSACAGLALVTSAFLLASCQNPDSRPEEETSAAAPESSAPQSATSSAPAASEETTETATTESEGPRATAEGHVVVLSTGGTIASTHDKSGAVVPTVTGSKLVEPLSGTFDKDKLTLEVKDIAKLDSSAMTLDDTDTIIEAVNKELRRDDVDGVVVTHGTDSMEETAIAVDTFQDSDKPVALTGAMRPFDDPDPDGPDNLALAVKTVTDPSNEGRGTFIAFADHVIPARGAFKSDTTKADGFANNNGKKQPQRPKALKHQPLGNTRVDIIAAYPGAPADLIQRSLDSGAEGIVVEGMGAGNIGDELAQAAKAAAKKVPVVLTTRVDHGPVEGIYGGAGGGATLADAGVISSGTLRAPQARMLLAAAISTDTDPAELFPDAD